MHINFAKGPFFVFALAFALSTGCASSDAGSPSPESNPEDLAQIASEMRREDGESWDVDEEFEDDDPADPGPDLSAEEAVAAGACGRQRWFVDGANCIHLCTSLERRVRGKCAYRCTIHC